MHTRVTPFVALAALCPVVVQAGVVTFEPVIPGSDVVHVDDLPASVDYNVFIMPDQQGESRDIIDAFVVLIGTDDPHLGLGFRYSQGFLDNAEFVFGVVQPVGLFESDDLFAGGSNSGLGVPTPPGALFGVLGIKTAQGTPLGDHFFYAGIEIGPIDVGPPAGTGVLTVVPEPGTLLLLGVGGVWLMGRLRGRGRAVE